MLRKGSGTLCESLLMHQVPFFEDHPSHSSQLSPIGPCQAARANVSPASVSCCVGPQVLFPNKHIDPPLEYHEVDKGRSAHICRKQFDCRPSSVEHGKVLKPKELAPRNKGITVEPCINRGSRTFKSMQRLDPKYHSWCR